MWIELSCVAALCRHTCSCGHDPTVWPSNEGSQKQTADREPHRWQHQGWGGQRQAELQQQMHRELCTLTPRRHVCSVLGQIPQNTPGSASLETETVLPPHCTSQPASCSTYWRAPLKTVLQIQQSVLDPCQRAMFIAEIMGNDLLKCPWILPWHPSSAPSLN